MDSHKQAGIALITVLLVLSLATVAAVSMTSRQQLDIRRTSNILQLEQAYAVLLAAEEAAKRFLIEDAKQNQTDSFADLWKLADPGKAPSLGGVKLVDFVIDDLQGRFNINNLVDNAGNPSDINRTYFQWLLSHYSLPENLAYTAIDWIDSNTIPSAEGGAEDADYQANSDNPYRAAQRPMISPSELYRLLGVNQTATQAGHDTTPFKRRGEIDKMILKDHLVTALPQQTDINVNTVASPFIYQMIADIPPDRAQALYDRIHGTGKTGAKPSPFTTVKDFLEAAGQGGVKNVSNYPLTVSSHYFQLRAEVENGGLVVYSNTILHRTGNTVKVVHRSYGKLGEI